MLALGMLFGKVKYSGLVSNPTGTVSADVSGGIDIFLQNSSVNFTAVSVGNTFDTSVNYSNASQFLLRNDGSVRVNVTISASALWNSTSGNNSNYRFNVTNASGNTSLGTVDAKNCSTVNVTLWYNMPLTSSTNAICMLNFTDGNDYARIDIQITVPTGEAAGSKSSVVTFTASNGQ
ncbi:MAG: hypothetical protein QXR53_04715 [Candidatus Norongarragalinales archaeon]